MSEQAPELQEPERPRLPTPWIIWALVGAIAVSYAMFMFLPPDVQEELDLAFGLMPARYDASNPVHFRSLAAMIAPLFGHAFLHVAWWHAATNGFFLFILGRWPALRLGWWRFLILFFVSSVAGALAYLLINPGSEEIAIGASGAVCGVFMAYFLSVRPRWQDALREPAIRNQLGMIFFLNVVVMGVLSELEVFPIAWEAHLGGFIGGAVAYIALERPMPRLPFA
ncbi:rhomboid family intramembrane serine protease [Terricaulis sp.]|uniref:rhomboid family intramembrane serine protease n=1 Tax=Terricaulis sp. TaxID=2768686 RepID=UPI003783593F